MDGCTDVWADVNANILGQSTVAHEVLIRVGQCKLSDLLFLRHTIMHILSFSLPASFILLLIGVVMAGLVSGGGRLVVVVFRETGTSFVKLPGWADMWARIGLDVKAVVVVCVDIEYVATCVAMFSVVSTGLIVRTLSDCSDVV